MFILGDSLPSPREHSAQRYRPGQDPGYVPDKNSSCCTPTALGPRIFFPDCPQAAPNPARPSLPEATRIPRNPTHQGSSLRCPLRKHVLMTFMDHFQASLAQERLLHLLTAESHSPRIQRDRGWQESDVYFQGFDLTRTFLPNAHPGSVSSLRRHTAHAGQLWYLGSPQSFPYLLAWPPSELTAGVPSEAGSSPQALTSSISPSPGTTEPGRDPHEIRYLDEACRLSSLAGGPTVPRLGGERNKHCFESTSRDAHFRGSIEDIFTLPAGAQTGNSWGSTPPHRQLQPGTC